MSELRLLDVESTTLSLRLSANSSNSSPRHGTQTPATSASDVDFEQDVAVVGMACRVAGGIDSTEKLWQAMMGKVDASSEIPSMRWEPYYRRDVRNAKVLENTTKRGYFIQGLENFDAAFFGISPKEAEQMDPQQRISLEVTWEALENAGIPPQSLSGSDTAVFMGVNSDDYSKLLLEDLPGVEAWMGIGTAYCGVPNRISYQLNLMGPSTAVDAACASSLVAIHHGRLAILQGESRIAIVGGVNALCGPGLTSVLDKAGATSSEGRCRSFDDSANGYGRGEGAAVVVLKNIADAMADGDNILAVLKGTAVAQDGRTNGIMAPNAKAQELVARKALDVAKTDPLTVGYVEAHATSTPLGDPTEVSAISAVYGRGRPSTDPCLIGSVKPNIGHLEAGAGVMGFIKAVMVVRAGILVPQANLEKVNPRIKWDESGVKVVQDAQDWPESDHARRAAICSYGYGGTVSHAVIEQHATAMDLDHGYEEGEAHPQILLLSSPQERRLAGLASSYASWIASTGKGHSLASIAATLSTRRGHHDYRVAIVAEDHKDAERSLELFAQGKESEWTSSARVVEGSKGVVWVFSGHGAQWADMGKELMKDAIFHNAVSSLDSIIEKECGFSALSSLEEGNFESSVEVQVLTYLMQVGLISVLRSKGLQPGAVIGHSVGEIAASVASGCLTAEEGALVVARRANLYRQMMGFGAMVLVNRPFAEMQAEFGERSDLAAAIDSSPSSCVVSGEKDAVEAFAEELKSSGSKAFRVKTDIAFHHPMLERLVEPLATALKGNVFPQPPKLPLYSTAMPDARSTALRDAAYWTTNMVQPVRLTTAVTAALEDGYRLFLEVSSNPILAHSIKETAMDRGVDDFTMASTMARNKPASKTILRSMAQLHCRGASIDWARQVSEHWATDVPVTAWNHKPFWRKIETGPLGIQSVHDVHKHTLLGQAVDIAGDDTTIFSTKMDEQTKPFPGSHPLHGSEIVPAAVLVNTFLQATGARTLSNMVLRVPVAVSQPRDIQVVVKKGGVKICSRLVQGHGSDGGDMSWLSHTTASWASDHELAVTDSRAQRMDVDAIQSRIGTRLADDFSIDYLAKVGVSAMGFPWAITEHFGNLKEMIARVDVAPSLPSDGPLAWDAHSWAPILDSATSVGSTIFFDHPRLRMPAHIDSVEVLTRQPPPKTGYLHVERPNNDVFVVHVNVLGDDGTVLARFRSMRFSEIEGTPGVSGSVESLVHQLAWVPATYTENALPVGHMVLISRDSDRSGRYEKSLRGRVKSVTKLSRAQELHRLGQAAGEILSGQDTIITYVPGGVADAESIPAASQSFIMELLEIVKFVAGASLSAKVFVLTDGVSLSADATALAQSPLHGLARIVASEQPELWGGLIDLEANAVPLELIKYVQGVDVVRVSDGIPREARLRPLSRDRLESNNLKTLLPHPGGTYLITGGLGALGLEVADFLVEQGARRLVLVSRRPLPPRSQWPETTTASCPLAAALERIMLLESRGATVHAVAVDVSSASAERELSDALAELSLPRVCGVVHAAGVLEDQLVLSTTADSFERVLAPKITGALSLDALFPVGTLDFMMLFSSCGQLFGFPGQASYASGNAFLDALATHRRALGDNTVALQWTSWRGLGMAASTDFINAELHAKGITDVTRDEAFRAWMHVSKYDTDHGVVLRSLALEADEPLPSAMLVDIAVRKPAASAADGSTAPAAKPGGIPESGPDRRAYLDSRIRECVAKVLHMGSGDEVDSKAPLSDLGVDSVMTVTLRAQLQKTLGVKVPPTLTWSCPTVCLLGEWFMGQLGK